MTDTKALLTRKPSLDILVPHFNDLEGFRLSLDSVRGQNWTGAMRLVVVDDGSEKRTFSELKALLEETELPYLLERNSENRGRPYTRNRLLDAIDGGYVAWLDAGDVWYSEKTRLQMEHLIRMHQLGHNIDQLWITCNYDWQWTGRRIRTVSQETGKQQFQELMLGKKLRAYLWTLLGTSESFRRAGRFDERLPRLQDLDYFLHFVRAGGRLETLPSSRAYCCYHKSDIGRKAREIRACNRLIHRKHLAALESQGPRFMQIIRYNAEDLSARFARNNGDMLTWADYRLRATLTDPRREAGAFCRRVLARL